MQAGSNMDARGVIGRASGETDPSWWDLLGVPTPAAPLWTEGNLLACPCAQLCALGTPAWAGGQGSALGFSSHAWWGTCQCEQLWGACLVGLSMVTPAQGSSPLLALCRGTWFDEERRACKATHLRVTRSFSNTRNAPVSSAKLVSVLSDLSMFPIPALPYASLAIDALWTLAVAEHLFNRNCLGQESALQSSFLLWEGRQSRRKQAAGNSVPL